MEAVIADLSGRLRKSLVCSGRKHMRIAVLLVALFTIVVGVLGIVSPDSGTAIRRQYFATPVGIYAAGVVRLVMGLAVILGASASRAPQTLRALGGRDVYASTLRRSPWA